LANAPGQQLIINYCNRFVYNLTPGIAALDGYFLAADGYAEEYLPTANGLGTGTQVRVKLGGNLIESYTLILFGDVNGDGNIDTADAGSIVDYENFLIEWDLAEDAAVLKAADLNGDGNVDTVDAGLIVDVENFLLTVDQTTGLAVSL